MWTCLTVYIILGCQLCLAFYLRSAKRHHPKSHSIGGGGEAGAGGTWLLRWRCLRRNELHAALAGARSHGQSEENNDCSRCLVPVGQHPTSPRHRPRSLSSSSVEHSKRWDLDCVRVLVGGTTQLQYFVSNYNTNTLFEKEYSTGGTGL